MTKAKQSNKSIQKTRNLDIHYRVMDLVHKNSDITQRELANKLGISLGSMHYCLKALALKGWIKVGNFKKNPNKSGYLYLLTPEGLTRKSMLAADFLRRKKEEFHKLKYEIEELSESLHEEE